jgi:predicted O-linked N-acetylglucosamine transferase (SPINDLY family)
LFAKAHFEMGNVYLAQVNYDAAGACFQKALSIDPEFAEAHNNVGIIFLHFDYFKEAKAHFEKALSLNPKSAETHHNIGRFYLKQGKLDQSIQSLRKAISLAPESASIFSNLIFILNYTTAMTQEDIYMESIAFDRQYSGGMVYDRLDYANEKNKDRKLRIGYISPDFRDHSVAYFFEPVLKNHNRKQFDVFCYDANAKKQDQVTRRLQDESDLWVAIPRWKSERVAERVKADRIDILIDLAGHSANNSLLVFARKPAPVQVTWLGYPNTTGLRAMDYRITDKVADPVGEADNLYSEHLSRLEHGFLCYQPDPSALDIASPPCMTEKYVTFGSFNNLSKITPEVVKVWATILTMVKESRLILKSPQLVDPEVQDIYRQMFAKQNIASDRIELFKMLPDKRDHFSLYNRVDIGLDPFPYNGTTTTCEALWMGVPVVTLRGNRHSGRVGASIIHGVGLDELVTGSIPAYIDLACSLAQDKQRLSGLRKNLRGQMQNSKLMDANLFVDSLESTFRQMWVNWCEQ